MSTSSCGRLALLEAAIPSERERLVRLCARLTGDTEAAEDLAQETLYEAWRNAHKLRDEEGYAQWLSAIARNVSLRWMRINGRELARHVAPATTGDENLHPAAELRAEDFEVEVELERSELAELLDRAMALLPPVTRAVLLERYVQEAPVAEVAARLRMSEGAVAMRLQRGKLLLRRVLGTDLKQEAAPYGLVEGDAEAWEQTRIWCPLCGQARLYGRFEPTSRVLGLRCPLCRDESSATIVNGGNAEIFAGVKGYKAALNRLMVWAHDYYTRGLVTRVVSCMQCGTPVPLEVCLDEDEPAGFDHGTRTVCAACGDQSYSALIGLSLCLPEGIRFWREHPRMRTLPDQEIEVAGSRAIVTTFESAGTAERFEVVFRAETFEVMSIHGASPA